MQQILRPVSPEARARMGTIAKTHSPFRTKWTETLELLEREVRQLGAYEYVLMVDVSERDIRVDGRLRADARPHSSDVAISLKTRSKGELLFACNRFWDWQDNVRAIALGLEALRRVDRYGITKANEQYRGWQALPPGTSMPAAKMTIEEACELLRKAAGWTDMVVYGGDDADIAFKDAAKRHHPDVGGDTAYFQRLVEARDLLRGAA